MKEIFKKLFFYRMHPDAALRYIPLVKILNNLNLLNSRILEVGSGSYGISPYLGKKITGLDTVFEEPKYELLNQIKGNGINLPFESNSFDVVILSDVLEHIPNNKRKNVINECERVARRIVLISGPCGAKAFNQDKYLSNFSNHHFFKEHLKYGLPEASDILDMTINKSEVVGEYLNLKLREWIMKFFVSENKLIYYFYLKGLMFFVPIFQLINTPPCYRTVIMIRKNL